MATASTLVLPHNIVLQSIQNDYLSYMREGGKYDRYLKFMESQAASPYAKFEVEHSTDGLVHIRSCQNQKYWTRQTNNYISATADKKDEDQSAKSCTLLKFISVDPAMNTVRIMHVKSGCYLCLWIADSSFPERGVYANYKECDNQSHDIFTMIDWSSLLILPRHVAFKGEGDFKDTYLCLCPYGDTSSEYLQFATQDVGDSTVACEIIPTDDGVNVRIKQISTQKFWRRNNNNWLVADSEDTSSDNEDTLFRPVKVDEKTIALFNLGNKIFCKRDSDDSIFNCLNAVSPSITKEARLTLVEAVMRREIYGFKYDVDNARVYDETVSTVASNSVENHTSESASLSMKLSYTDTKIRSWKGSASVTLGIKEILEVDVPLVAKEGVEISFQLQVGFEWGTTNEISNTIEVDHGVIVPKNSKKTVNLVATRGKCDVPLSYMQKDTLYDGTVIKTKILGAYFTGSNYYNFVFDDKDESLDQQ